jgi:EAL domain-containing protein (putative c-di-GMP-specific phosphodiesterase class I)
MFRKSRRGKKDINSFSRTTIHQSLCRALERNEFIVHYQPLIDTRSWLVSGAEALIRWQHPRFGLLAPAQFIPLAEESDLIVYIGEWILRTACRQLQSWHADGLKDLYLAVNMSARQFHRPDPAAVILRVLRETGIHPQSLTVELTESSVIGNSSSVCRSMLRLNELGVKLALDDFGKGFSSFEYLTRLPLDVLKIDESLVRNAAMNPADATVLSIIINLGHKLRMSVIAEGLETEAQLKALARLRCNELQGFVFSKPLPAKQFRRWVMMAEPSLRAMASRFQTVEQPARALTDTAMHPPLARLGHS